jgi:hypothetical protein
MLKVNPIKSANITLNYKRELCLPFDFNGHDE